MKKIIPIQQSDNTAAIIADANDNHVILAREFSKNFNGGKTTPQKNLTQVPVHTATRKNKVALILAPMWGPQVAPYGIARMAGLSRGLGFETQCWDINIQCYQELGENLWHQHLDWKWCDTERYALDIHPLILPILEKCVAEIVKFQPTIVGFTMYYTNNRATTWLITQLKKQLPGVKIIAGGPQATQGKIDNPEIIDHFVRGEGELLFSQLLENIELNEPPLPQVLIHDKNIRIDLDSMPIPDYRDFDISLYEWKGVASELSRGCIAKCQFCSETTFWRYRGRLASNVLDEVEYNYRTFGIQTVWFIDSLVNGNLKELLAFAQGIIDRGIKIRWTGFARNDGRMTREYLKTLIDSGCSHLLIGVESGSQKVLDLIQKKVKVHEIEQNFRDLAVLNAFYTAGTSWFVGFPGEEPVDFAQTLTLVWRLRNSGVNHLGFGACNLNPDTPLSLERERFNVSPGHLGGSWLTNDFTNTLAHRIIRYKSVYILQDHYRKYRVRKQFIGRSSDRPAFQSHYNLTYDIANWNDDIPYELDFDFNIVKPNINTFADSLVNEIWPLLRVLWLSMGPYTLTVEFDPEQDYQVLGSLFYFKPELGKLWASHYFEIDSDGNWIADFYHRVEITHHTDIDCNFEHKWRGHGNWSRPAPNKKE